MFTGPPKISPTSIPTCFLHAHLRAVAVGGDFFARELASTVEGVRDGKPKRGQKLEQDLNRRRKWLSNHAGAESARQTSNRLCINIELRTSISSVCAGSLRSKLRSKSLRSCIRKESNRHYRNCPARVQLMVRRALSFYIPKLSA